MIKNPNTITKKPDLGYFVLLLCFLEGNNLSKFFTVFFELKLDTREFLLVLGRPIGFAGVFIREFYEIWLWHSGKTIAEKPSKSKRTFAISL